MRSILILVGLFSGSFQAFASGSSCMGLPVTQQSLLAHFAAGATTAPLGAVTLSAETRQCNSLSGCSAWVDAQVQPKFSTSEVWEYDYNQFSTTSTSTGFGPVAMPTEAIAQLAIENGKIRLDFQVGGVYQQNQQSTPYFSAQSFYDPAAGTFTSSSSGFYGQYYSTREPAGANRFCQRDGMHLACLAGHNYVMGRFDVSDVENVQKLTSLFVSAHCLDAVYENSSSNHSDGSHTEARIHVSGSF